jgi:inner membrane protein
MASILSHPAVPLAIGLGLGTRIVPPKLLLAAVIACVIPDLDVAAFRFGIPYDAALGHRGFTHSILFALTLGTASAAVAPALRTRAWFAFLFVALSAASHGFLDAFTNGGRGVMFFWPLDDARLFFPWRVILVSPIGVRAFISGYGLEVLRSEAIWIWLPACFLALLVYACRRLALRRRALKD